MLTHSYTHCPQECACKYRGLIPANALDEEIDKLQNSTGECHCDKRYTWPSDCHGWQAGVAIVNKLYGMPT